MHCSIVPLTTDVDSEQETQLKDGLVTNHDSKKGSESKAYVLSSGFKMLDNYIILSVYAFGLITDIIRSCLLHAVLLSGGIFGFHVGIWGCHCEHRWQCSQQKRLGCCKLQWIIIRRSIPEGECQGLYL